MDYQDRREAYADEIYHRAIDMIATRIDEVLAELYFDTEAQKRYETAIRVMVQAKSTLSQGIAQEEIGEIIHNQASRMAEKEYAYEMAKAAQDLAMARFCNYCARHGIRRAA